MGLFDFLKKKPPTAAQDPRLEAWIADLKHADALRRIAACDSLGSLGRSSLDAVAALEETMMDDDNLVCEAAARAVNDIRRAM
jgi:hypothetical protein